MRFVVLAAVIVSVAGCNSKPVEKKEEVKTDLRQIELGRVKAKLVESLKDPSTAQFRHVRRVPMLAMAGTDPWDYAAHYCGEVNGKNSFGAYSGFQKFHVFGPNSKGEFNENPVSISDPAVPASALAYMISCEDNGKIIEGIPVEFPK